MKNVSMRVLVAATGVICALGMVAGCGGKDSADAAASAGSVVSGVKIRNNLSICRISNSLRAAAALSESVCCVLKRLSGWVSARSDRRLRRVVKMRILSSLGFLGSKLPQ